MATELGDLDVGKSGGLQMKVLVPQMMQTETMFDLPPFGQHINPAAGRNSTFDKMDRRLSLYRTRMSIQNKRRQINKEVKRGEASKTNMLLRRNYSLNKSIAMMEEMQSIRIDEMMPKRELETFRIEEVLPKRKKKHLNFIKNGVDG